MKTSTTLRLRVYAIAGAMGLVAALAVGEPEPAILGVALLVLVVVGVVAVPTPDVSVEIVDAPSSLVEGEERRVAVRVAVSEPVKALHIDLRLGDGLRIDAVDRARVVDRSILVTEVNDVVDLEVTVVAEGWGRRSVGPVEAYLDSTLGMLESERVFSQTARMVSVPSDAIVNELLVPRETNLHAGDLVSKLRGVGSEFAEMRPFQAGDDPRSLNWRVSSRSGSLWVNERHPERNGDVVLVVDAQIQPDTGMDLLVDRAVRLTGSLLREYGRKRYRLGLVTVDGVARWIRPGSGEQHRRRIVEQLLGVQVGESSRAAIERAVLRAAGRPALVIMLTPLLDDSLAGISHSLRVSGMDVAIIELDPIGYLPPPSSDPRALGRRLWAMERERLRDRLAGDGIPVAPWRVDSPPDVPLSQVSAWRSSWRLPV